MPSFLNNFTEIQLIYKEQYIFNRPRPYSFQLTGAGGIGEEGQSQDWDAPLQDFLCGLLEKKRVVFPEEEASSPFSVQV